MTGYFRDDGPLYELMLDDAGPAGAGPALAGVRLHHRRPDAAVFQLPLVRARREPLPARPRVRLRPRRGQGRRLRGQDQAARRGLPGEGAPDRRRRAPRSRRSPTSSRSSPRASAGSSATGPRPSRATSRPSRRSPSGPIAARSRRTNATGSPTSIGHSASEDGLGHEDAVRDTVVGVLMSPHFCYRVDLPGGGARASGRSPTTTWRAA